MCRENHLTHSIIAVVNVKTNDIYINIIILRVYYEHFDFTNVLLKTEQNLIYMKMKTILFAASILFITLQSCSPKVKTSLRSTSPSEINTKGEVLVVNEGEKKPTNSKLVGEFKVSRNGYTKDCSYLEVLNLAKEEARKNGANLIVISSIKKPGFSSICYRIKGKMYVNKDESELSKLKLRNEKKNASRLSGDEDYAIVHFYRPPLYTGSFLGYKVRLGDEVIGKVRNGKKFEYKVTDFGKKKFWAKTESKEEIEIDIKKGQEYFVRCGFKMGIVVVRPDINITENHIGITESKELREAKKSKKK